VDANRTPITDAVWKTVEEMYLESAEEEQKAEYAGMTPGERWDVLEPFLLSRSKTKWPEPWMKLIIERMSATVGAGS